jgi:hypothetical protein
MIVLIRALSSIYIRRLFDQEFHILKRYSSGTGGWARSIAMPSGQISIYLFKGFILGL